jgi:GNAT superfamily N-acetyltransferase
MRLRPAVPADVPALEELIARSARALSEGFYTPEQAEAAIRHVFGVDSQLVEDGTYFVVDLEGRLLACGGWSARRTLYGGDRAKRGPDPPLDAATEPARIRAFFVDPAVARRGIGRRLLRACVEAAGSAGFRALELVATLPGVPFYAACGFRTLDRRVLDLHGVEIPVVHMRREI